MTASDVPASYDAIRSAQLRAVGAAFLRVRPLIVAPGMVLVLIVLFLADVARGQLIALSAGFSCMLAFFGYEAVRLRRAALTERGLFISLLITLFGITVASVITGGLGSPLLPMLFAPVVTGFAAFGRGRESAVLFAGMIAVLAALAVVPRGVPFAVIPAPHSSAIMFGAMVICAILLLASVSGLTRAYWRSGQVLDRMRAAALDDATGRLRDLDAVGAKVAHEIKNPLSAVKGLVQLVAKKPANPRQGKRCQVILDEVERIETILRDYLGFSRPFGDLSPTRLQLDELVADVVAVLEVRARDAEVVLEHETAGVELVADRRRLKEALFNLCDNAIAATPPGGRVARATALLVPARARRPPSMWWSRTWPCRAWTAWRCSARCGDATPACRSSCSLRGARSVSQSRP